MPCGNRFGSACSLPDASLSLAIQQSWDNTNSYYKGADKGGDATPPIVSLPKILGVLEITSEHLNFLGSMSPDFSSNSSWQAFHLNWMKLWSGPCSWIFHKWIKCHDWSNSYQAGQFKTCPPDLVWVRDYTSNQCWAYQLRDLSSCSCTCSKPSQ